MLPRRYDTFQRLCFAITPVMVTIILFAFFLGFFNVPDFTSIRPRPMIACVYFWCLFYPRFMPYGVVFVLGLVEDSFTGAFFGLGAMNLVITKFLTQRYLQKIVRQGFIRIWIGFFIVATLVFVSEYVIIVAKDLVVHNPINPATQLALTILIYPFLHVLLSYIHLIISRR